MEEEPEPECPISSEANPSKHCYVFNKSYPSWSPDGQYIAYVTSDQEREGIMGLYIFNLANQTEKHVIDGADNMSSQAWSPDGSTIAYVNIDYFEGRGKIWLMDPDGTNRRPMIKEEVMEAG